MKPKTARVPARHEPAKYEPPGPAGDLTQAMARLNGIKGSNATAPVTTKRPTNAKPKAATRVDKVGLVLYVDPRVNKAMRRAAIDNDTSLQALGQHALRLLFDHLGIDLPGVVLNFDAALASPVSDDARSAVAASNARPGG
jgi:hypothetical protein